MNRKERAENEQHHAEERREVGGQQSSRRDAPHATANDEHTSQIQQESQSLERVPALPANASGTDRVPTDDQDEEIDPASMYDRRPGQDKDRAPSDTP